MNLAPRLISYSCKQLQYQFVKGQEPKKLTEKQLVILHKRQFEKVGRIIDAKKGSFSLYKAILAEWRTYCKEPFAPKYRPIYKKTEKID